MLGSLTAWCVWFAVAGGPSAEVVTVAGDGKAEHVGGPFGVVVGPDDALYVCETTNHVVRRLDRKTGRLTTVAGSGTKGYSGDGGPATKAKLNEPYEVRFDSNGHLLFVEMQNHVVRRVDAQTGVISTVAGTGQAGFSGDGGPATKATFKQPHSIVLDSTDNLYVCDIGNHRVRRVDAQTGVVTTFAGNGKKLPTPDGAPVAGTPLNGPRALDVAADGTLYLALREGNAVYRIDMRTKTLHHLAGTGKQGYTGDGGPAKAAKLSGPKGVAVGPEGDVYLADTESHTIRVVRLKTGTIETLVGDGKPGDGPDGDPHKCRLNRPHGACVDRQGRVYVGDSNNHKVRVLRFGAGPNGSDETR